MLVYSTSILKFDRKGEKTGWQYILISEKQAEELNPGVKTSYRVKGKLDDMEVRQKALMPMGDGSFILPVNQSMRRKLRKRAGDSIKVAIVRDDSTFKLHADLIECLDDEPEALEYFNSLPRAHQRYFSKWIDSAKTAPTIARRIARTIDAMYKKQRFDEMMKDKN